MRSRSKLLHRRLSIMGSARSRGTRSPPQNPYTYFFRTTASKPFVQHPSRAPRAYVALQHVQLPQDRPRASSLRRSADGLSRCSSIRLITFLTPPGQPRRPPRWPQKLSLGAGPGRGVHSAAVRGCGLHGGAARPLRRSAIWHAPGASTFGNSRPCERRIDCHLRGVPARKADQALKSGGGTVDGRAVFSAIAIAVLVVSLLLVLLGAEDRYNTFFLEPLAGHERLADLWGGKPL